MRYPDTPAEHLRRRILDLMRDGRERTAADVANALREPRARASHALGVLRQSGRIDAAESDNNLPRIYRGVRGVAS